MSENDTPEIQSWMDPEIEARVVAWVLGEASEFEAAEMERIVTETPELAVFKRRIESVHGLVGAASKPEGPGMRMDTERRRALIERLGGKAETAGVVAMAAGRKRGWLGPLRGFAAVAAVLAVGAFLSAVFFPVFNSAKRFAWGGNRGIIQNLQAGSSFPGDSALHIFKSDGPVGTTASQSKTTGQIQIKNEGDIIAQSQQLAQNSAMPATMSAAMAREALAASGRYAQGMAMNGAQDDALKNGVAERALSFSGATSVSAGLLGTDGNRRKDAAKDSFGVTASGNGGPTATGASEKIPTAAIDALVMPASPAESKAVGVAATGAGSSITGAGGAALADTDEAAVPVAPASPPISGLDTTTPVTPPDGAADSNAIAGLPGAMAARAAPENAPTQADYDKAPASLRDRRLAQEEAGIRDQKSGVPILGDMPTMGYAYGVKKAMPMPEQEPRAGSAGEDAEAGIVGGANGGTVDPKFVEIQQQNEKKLSMGALLGQFRIPGQNTFAQGGTSDLTAEGAVTAGPLADKLNRIVIPKLEFRDATLKEVVDVLNAKSRELDTEETDPGKQGVPIRVTSAAPDQRITLSLNNIPLIEALRYVCTLSNTQLTIEPWGVSVVTENAAPSPSAAKNAAPLMQDEVRAADEPFSTFSLHVSDVSFLLARAALAAGQMPDPESVRPEEFYNAFDYGDPAPGNGERIACKIEQAAHPDLQERNLVRISMKVGATGRGQGQPLRLTVLLDTSGSMERADREAAVKAAMGVLAKLLSPGDEVTLIGFARQPRLLADGLGMEQAGQLVDIVAHTPPEGGTNMEEAIKLAGEMAQRHEVAGAQNRIVLLTDGAANLGDADPEKLAGLVAGLREKGITFDACGVGADGLNDDVLEALTRKGGGRYYFLNGPEDADEGFARQLAGTLRPAAEDVKMQVRFNPARVGSYKLIGFEKNRLKTEDFRNDKVTAGQLAAEEAGVAVYQVQALPDGDGEIGEVFVRFRDPASGRVTENSWTIPYEAQAPALDKAAPSMQLAAVSALMAEKLKGGAVGDAVDMAGLAQVMGELRSHYAGQARVGELGVMYEEMRRMEGGK